MVRRFSFVLFLLFIFSGCQGVKQDSPVAIEIGKMKVTVAEFEEALKSSSFAKGSGPSAKREFLDNFITRKLILREAEREGLDKDPKFLKDVELFWQQSLLKLMLDKKIKELSLDSRVEDEEVRSYYQARRDTDFANRTLEEVYDQIKFLILWEKQRQSLSAWTDSLKKGSNVKIRYELLNIEQ